MDNAYEEILKNDDMFIRIPLKKISFRNSYEQQKFEKLVIEHPQKTISEIEQLLIGQSITILLD